MSTNTTTSTNPSNIADAPDYGIIVHCHLRWDFVWQRPQHVISRLSQAHPVLFLEDLCRFLPALTAMTSRDLR